MNPVQDIEEIKQSAQACEMFGGRVERIGAPALGDVVRQGDLYLVCIDRKLLSSRSVLTPDRQLAPGTTQGSRHVISGDCKIYNNHAIEIDAVPSELTGPMFICVGECVVEHPEHGHKILPADTAWVVVYQRAFGEELRRVRD